MASLALCRSLRAARNSTLKSFLFLQANTIRTQQINLKPLCSALSRNLSTGTMYKCQEQKNVSSTPIHNNQSVNINPSVAAYKPTKLEKRFLVWTGKYKSVEEVPNFVRPDEMERSRSKLRIRIANVMMLLTLVGCYFMVRSGKKAAERGETVQKMNLDWHKKYNEEAAAAKLAEEK